MKKRIPAWLLAVSTAVCLLAGCGGSGLSAGTTDLMEGVTAQPVSAPGAETGEGTLAAADFGLRLFQETWQGGNTLVSPLSVLSALAMTANGAEGETLAQMEALFGLPMESLNPYLFHYIQGLPQGETCRLDVANSIWFKDAESFQVNGDFLKTNAAWYNAGLYEAPFDGSTVKDINTWVNDNTHGMIPEILESLSPSAVMCLVNALAFDGEWQDIYFDFQVREDIFTTEDGTRQNAELMYSQEWCYLEEENACGVMKDYAGGSYAFAALLPNEGISLREYTASLTGEKLCEIFANARQVKVETAIPKFSTEYSAELSGILRDMGMTDAFDPGLADFSGMGTSEEGPLFISQVLHKTFINVDEKGTQAGAATAVMVEAGSAAPVEEEIKKVYLDRPFLYLIVDKTENLPIFLGAVTRIET